MSNSTILKQETKEQHDAIERVMNSSLLFSNQFTTEHYKHFIIQSYKYVDILLKSVTHDWPQYLDLLNKKLNALTSDINYFNLDNPTSIINIDNTKYYKLGLIYIILGAMLGNKIILKKLKEYPSFNNLPFNYLNEHQESLSIIWKEFQSKIDQLNHGQLEDVIKGAKDGYLLFSL